jgi:hypothetical protein
MYLRFLQARLIDLTAKLQFNGESFLTNDNMEDLEEAGPRKYVASV